MHRRTGSRSIPQKQTTAWRDGKTGPKAWSEDQWIFGLAASQYANESQMRVLVACEFSGIVRDAFLRRGHDAMSCDLLPTEALGPHIQGDVFDALRNSWDLIILHPPCTRIALCGNATYGRGMAKHTERIASLDWTESLWNTAKDNSPRVALEQPKSVIGSRIGKRSQAIQPYQFGHLEQKETWLWLHGLPLLVDTNNVFGEMMKLPRNVRERIHFMSPSKFRGHERSRTFAGIAEAMAKQWGAT